MKHPKAPTASLSPELTAATVAALLRRVAALEQAVAAGDARVGSAESALGAVAADVAALNVHVGALIAVSGRAEAQKRAAAALVKALDDAGVLTECAGKGGGVG